MNAASMNEASMNEANRMTRIREMLREKAARGMLGVAAAQASTSEGFLREWLDFPARGPSQLELAAIERALFPEETAPVSI